MVSPAAVLRAGVSAVLLFAAATFLPAEDHPGRTVTIRLAVDRSVSDLTDWRFRANDFIEGSIRTFHSRFGIKLVFKAPVRWQPSSGRKPIDEALRELAVKVEPEGCDIVLGIVDPERITSSTLGIASYINACVLIVNAEDPEQMRYAALHEISHVFGAIDLDEKSSLMGIRDPGLHFDKFTSDAILLHRDRSFSRGAFPLAQDSLDAGIALYQARAALDLKEPETHVFLTLFHLEKGDLEAATRECDQAVAEDPDLMGVQVLLGNILLGRGEPNAAIDHYQKAMKRQPADPGLHFNLALALTELRQYKEAARQCREALRIDPDLVAPRLALARLLLAAGSTEAAIAEARLAVKSDPRSAEALCVLGTAMVALGRPFSPVPEIEDVEGLDIPNTIRPGTPEAETAVADAVRFLEMSVSLDPQNVESRVSLGTALACQDKFSEAESRFLEALNLDPENLNAHFGLGNLYLEQGETRKAIFHLEQILAIDPASDLGSRMVSNAFQARRAFPFYRRTVDR